MLDVVRSVVHDAQLIAVLGVGYTHVSFALVFGRQDNVYPLGTPSPCEYEYGHG